MIDFEFKKSLGQNFINDNNIIDKIVKYSDINRNTLVIEIGPGSGSLSGRIVPLSGYSILYEIDTRLENMLTQTLKEYTNYKIIFGDFLKQDLTKIRIEYEYKMVYVIANLPYYITTPIIVKLLNEVYPDKMVLMVQDEVADRLSASYGSRDYGMISVLLSSKYDVKKLFKVSKNCFIPSPNVDSAVISLIKNDKLIGIDSIKFEKIIKDAFKFKRKNLKNNLKGYNLLIVEDVLKKYNYTLSNRAEEIPVDIFIEITRYI